MRLLLINANTNAGVTDLCAAAARAVASPSTTIVPLTGRFGAKIIESRSEIAIAAHALLELIAEHRESADAALIAVSYDPCLEAARELAGFPVLGITQASLIAAGMIGQRIGIATLGTPWLYRELATKYGFAERLAGIEVATAAATDAYANPDAMSEALTQAARKLVSSAGADVVVLCGAAFSGLAARLQASVPVPLVDGVSCGVPLCEMLVRAGFRRPPVPGGSNGGIGLSDALQKALYE
jgi:allantoin racemase